MGCRCRLRRKSRTCLHASLEKPCRAHRIWPQRWVGIGVVKWNQRSIRTVELHRHGSASWGALGIRPPKGALTMKRSIIAVILCLGTWCSSAQAGSWADGLFSELRHEFGNIPRGSDQRCSFVVRNTMEVPVRITGMSRSCGCTLITLDDKVMLDQNIKSSHENKAILPGQEV